MKKLLLIMMLAALSISLIGCNKESEEVITDTEVAEGLDTNLEEEKEQEVKTDVKICEDYYKDKIKTINDGLAEELSVFTDVFSKATFDCKGNSVTYEYKFASTYKPEETNLFEQDFDSLISATKLAIKDESGCTPDTVTFRYLDSKGKLLFEVTK